MKIKWQEDEWVPRRIETAVGKVQTPDEVGEVADGAVVGNGRRLCRPKLGRFQELKNVIYARNLQGRPHNSSHTGHVTILAAWPRSQLSTSPRLRVDEHTLERARGQLDKRRVVRRINGLHRHALG